VLIVRLQGNVLVDENEVAVLCDAGFGSVTSKNDGSIPSKCWWMPHERLIVDTYADDKCALTPPSFATDIYGISLTIMQVRPASMKVAFQSKPWSMLDVDPATALLQHAE